MSRKRHQFLKCQNLPCSLGQALVLNETGEGAGSKFRAEGEGGGRAIPTLAASFKALVSTSRALLSPQNFFCRFHPPDRCLEGLQSSVRITAPGHCPLEKGFREASMPPGRTQTHPSDQANIRPSNPIKSLFPLHGSRGRWTHTP